MYDAALLGESDDLFAGTPPLVTIRVLLSLLAKRRSEEADISAMVIDVKGAFLYGRTKRRVYIWLPGEDKKSSEGYMARLEKAMYGTRDAPQVWQEEVRSTMEGLGFIECVTQPGIYFHESRKLQIVSHVDDFLCVGREMELEWFKAALQEKYDIMSKLLNGRNREVIFLGRKIVWTDSGIEMEADSMHVDILLEELKMKERNPCDTPISGDEGKADNESDMNARDATLFRHAAARIN